MNLTNAEARQLILHLQGLTHPPHKAFEPLGLPQLIDQLGFVQLDSIRWMERAHQMTLFARNQTFRPKKLQKLHEAGHLFENWTHDASLIPAQFWRYWKHKFSRDEERLRQKFTNWQGEGFIKKTDGLLDRIATHGAICSRDLEKPKGKPLEMWQWHDGKAALEFLWRTGQIAVPRRQGFQKYYDLSNKVIPEEHFSASCSHDEFVDWACRSALDRLGFGTAGDIARYWDLLSIGEVREWLAANRNLETVTIQGFNNSNDQEFVARADLEQVISEMPKAPERIRILSPFDPVIRDRKRLAWLFGFDYRIEIYVPPEKRKYGYYIFPLLESSRLIGRVDCQARRTDGVLYVTKLWLEPKVRWSQARNDRFVAELVRQARLCEVKEIDWNIERIQS